MQERRGALKAIVGLGLALALAVWFWAGCGDDADRSPLAGVAELRDLVIVAGNNQQADPGKVLEESLTVQAMGRKERPVSGVTVRFAVIAGGGALLDAGAAGEAIREVVTGADGQAHMRLQLGPVAGINRVTATVEGMGRLPATFTAQALGTEGDGGDNGDNGTVAPPVAGGRAAAEGFSLAVERLNLPGGVRFGETNRVTAYVYDAQSNPVPEGAVVRFRTTGGGIEEQGRTNALGQASVVLTTAGPVPADGWATVSAETAGPDSVVRAGIRVLFSGSAQIRLTGPDDFRMAAGERVELTFFVGDANGHPLVAGSTVRVSAEGGTIVGTSDFELPDTQLPEATRFAVVFHDAGSGATPAVSVQVSSPNGAAQAVFAGQRLAPERGEPASIVAVSVEPPAIGVRGAGANETSQVVLEVRDGLGRPVADGTVVRFRLTGVSSRVEPQSAQTVGGRVQAVVGSDTQAGTIQLVAEALPAGGDTVRSEPVQIAVHGGLPDGDHFNLAVEQLNVASPGGVRSGQEFSITAYVFDRYANPVPAGTVVYFTTDGGGIQGSAVTEASGRAAVILTTAGQMEALVTVTARTQGAGGGLLEARTRLLFSGAPRIRLTGPDDFQVAAGERVELEFFVGDANGHPLVAGSTVQVSAEGGTIIGTSDFELPDTQSPEATRFAVAFEDAGSGATPAVSVQVTSPNGAAQAVFAGERVLPEAPERGEPASIVAVSVEPPAIGVRGAGANETALVVLEVRDGLGEGVADGTPVLFRLTGVSNRVQPERAETVGGRVQAVVSSDTQAGTIQLIAEAPLAAGDTVRSEPVRIAVHGGLPDGEHFHVAAEQLNIASPGGVRSGQAYRITAYVFDRYANPVPAGTAIYFTTDRGGIDGSALTDAAGRASVVLTTAGQMDGLATVTARTQGIGGESLEARTQLLFSGATQVRLIQPANFAVTPGERQTIHFFVGDANGHPLSAGTMVSVGAVDGRIVGESSFVLPDTQSPEATRFAVVYEADAEGLAQMSIQVASPNGDKNLTLINGQESPGQEPTTRVPTQLSVVAEDTVLVADGVSQTTIRVAVRDSAGHGVANQTVEFAVSAGRIDGAALTDAAGRAMVVYRSAVNPEGVPQVVVTALSGALSGETQLRLLGVRLQVLASSATLAADGFAQSTITAALETEDGIPIPFVPVDFSASLGRLSAAQATTGVTGRATVVYTGVASAADLPEVRVRARAAGLDAAAELRLLGVQLGLSLSQDTLAADGNTQAIVSLQLQRSDGQPIVNAGVALHTSLGRLSASRVETDAAGRAQAILVSGTTDGKAIVRATYGELSAQTEAVFVKGPPASILLVSVDPPAIGVRGTGVNETALVTFEVRDARGNTVADGEWIHFRLQGPSGLESVGPDSTQTVDGRVYATVQSDTLAGAVQLIARASGTVRSEPVPIAIHGGHPHQRHFSVAPRPVNLAGRVILGLESQVTAYVFDRYANPVPKGTAVYFTTSAGGIQGSGLTDENGQTTVRFFTANPMPPAVEGYLAQISARTVDKEGDSIETGTTILFSGPTAPIQVSEDNLRIPNGGSRIVTFTVADIDGNPIMGGSTIQVTSDVAEVSGNIRVVMPDTRSPLYTHYSIVIGDPDSRIIDPKSGTVLISVESLNGNTQRAISVSIDVMD